jgi:hypothetical protein
MAANSIQNLKSFDSDFEEVERVVAAAIKSALDASPEQMRINFERRLVEARWLLDEADRIEVEHKARTDFDTFLIITVVGLAVGLVGFLLSLFPFFESTLNFINSRSLFLLLLIGPVVMFGVVGLSVDYLVKRIETQTLEHIWMRWSALGLTIDLLSDCLLRGKFKLARYRSEDKKYGRKPRDSRLDRIDTAENELLVRWALLGTIPADDRWVFVVSRGKLQELRASVQDLNSDSDV